MSNKETVYGWGINDSDYKTTRWENGKPVWYCPYYSVWTDIVRRCHCQKFKAKYETYKNCIISENWKYFSNFRSWMEKQDWEGKQLDKDILYPNNKHYSAETCIFVPSFINTLLVNSSQKNNGSLLGTYLRKDCNKYAARCRDGSGRKVSLGVFPTPEEAHEAWRQYKHKLSCRYAEEQTDPRIAHALRQWYKPNGWYKQKEAN